MTNPTPPGQVPDAIDVLRAHAENKALRAQQDDAYDHGPQAETVEEAARDVGKWLNERPNRPLDLRHVAMLTHHAKRTAHVQNPAEIEHVAGDVVKDGAEVNTSTQQPAPATPITVEQVEDAIGLQSSAWDTIGAEKIVEAVLRLANAAPATQQAREVSDAMVLAALQMQHPAAYGQYLRHPANGPKTSIRTEAEIDTARRMIAAALAAAPQPSPAAHAASSTVLKAIREANMQLVRTGDNAFMLVPYKVATAQAAESVPAPVLDSLLNIVINHEARATPEEVRSMAAELATYRAARAPAESVPAISDLPPLPDPDLRDVGTKPQDVKDFLNGYATEYARLALASRAPAESVGRDAPEAALSPQVHLTRNTLLWWRELASINPQDLVPRIDAVLAANGGNK